MTRKLYELKHPIYPHPDLLKAYAEHKMEYRPYPGSYDSQYNNWYQLVRADHDTSGAKERDIFQEVQQIIRLKSASKDYILVAENLIGTDHQNNPVEFFHTYGSYQKPGFRTMYNYETKTSSTVFSGQVQTVYFLPLDKMLLEKLYQAGPDDKDIGLYVNAGSVQYGGRGFYSYDEFKDLKLEELAEKGRTGKGMFSQKYATIPTADIATEMRSLGQSAATIQQQQQQYQEWKTDPKTWNEFQEFKKWKEQSERQRQQSQSQQSQTKGK